MAKDGKRKKVKSKSSTKYETSSDEDNCSDEEDNLRTLFANLNMQQKEKLNELISAIHEKDDLLDSQEDFLIKENKKHVKVKNRDGNSARGHGYPRVPYPMGMDTGKKSHPRVRIRATLLTRG
jgi:hypothetical protein